MAVPIDSLFFLFDGVAPFEVLDFLVALFDVLMTLVTLVVLGIIFLDPFFNESLRFGGFCSALKFFLSVNVPLLVFWSFGAFWSFWPFFGGSFFLGAILNVSGGQSWWLKTSSLR